MYVIHTHTHIYVLYTVCMYINIEITERYIINERMK